jgi:hypothetical protein
MSKKNNVDLGHSVTDADKGWIFAGVIDYGAFGAGNCHIQNHAIRYGYIVQNPNNPNEQHVYGSDCITKFWLACFYKDLSPEKFTELYKKHHTIFKKLAKLLYQLGKYGYKLEKKDFPQNFLELSTTMIMLKNKLKTEIKRRKALWKEAKNAYTKARSLRKNRRLLNQKKLQFLQKYPDFRSLVRHQNEFHKLPNGLENIARDFILRFNQHGEVHHGGLTPKQETVLKRMADVLEGRTPPSTNGNPSLIAELVKLAPSITNTWITDDFLPSIIKQLGYKKDLSPKQWAVLDRNGIDVQALKQAGGIPL